MNEKVGIIKINCVNNMYGLNMYVYPFAEVQQYTPTILDSGVIYPCNVNILLQMIPESAAGQTTTPINTFTL